MGVRPILGTAAFLTFAAVAACSGAASSQGQLPSDPLRRSSLADPDDYTPDYGRTELQKAVIAERASEVSQRQRIARLEERGGGTLADDQLRVARADLGVQRRFLATLESCEATGRFCPPRLDDPAWSFDIDPDTATAPPVTAPLAFDLAGWRTLAAELHGRACACRTMVCVDSVGVAIDQLERRPAPEVEGDETSSRSITRARECLFRLRGRVAIDGRRFPG